MLIPGRVRGDPCSERVHRRGDHARPRAEEDDRGRHHPVVLERQRQRDHQDEEAERLLPHSIRRAAEREDDHQDRDQDRTAVPEAKREPADPGLDRLRLHRHRDERADREHEQEDRRRAVEEAFLPRPDEALRALHAVEPVRRRVPELLEAERERLVDARRPRGQRLRNRRRGGLELLRSLAPPGQDRRARRLGLAGRKPVVRAGDGRCRLRIDVVRAGWDEEGRDPDEHQHRGQNRECCGEPEFPRRAALRRGLFRRLAHQTTLLRPLGLVLGLTLSRPEYSRVESLSKFVRGELMLSRRACPRGPAGCSRRRAARPAL